MIGLSSARSFERTKRWPRRSAIGAVAAAWVGAATAAQFDVAPIRFVIQVGQTSASTQVTNRGKDSLAVQARAFEWIQEGASRTRYEATQALIASPPVFSLTPNDSQTLRVGLREASARDVEQAYRIVLDELPSDRSARTTAPGLSLALRIDMPVFVRPSGPVKTDVDWSLHRQGPNRLALTAVNHGNVHLQVLEIEADGAALSLVDSELMYVLPGATRRWVFKTKTALPSAGTTVSIHVRTNEGEQTQGLVLEPTG